MSSNVPCCVRVGGFAAGPPGRLEGRKGVRSAIRRVGWTGKGGVYWGRRAGIVSPRGSKQARSWDVSAGAGPEGPRRSPRARRRRGPGQRQDSWVAQAGLTSGFAAAAATALLYGGSFLLPSAPVRGQRRQPAETETSEGSGRVGGPWAQLLQGPGERPPRIPLPVRETPPGLGRHIPRRTPPS